MKKVLFAAAMCVMLLCSSCGGSVSQDSITKKATEAAEKDEVPTFSEKEYEFMADWLTDNAGKLANIENLDSANEKDFEFFALCMTYLTEASKTGKLSKSVQEKYDAVEDKFTQAMGVSAPDSSASSSAGLRPIEELTNEELIVEYAQLAGELAEEFNTTGTYDNQKLDRMMHLQVSAYSAERGMTLEEIQAVDAIAEAYTEAVAQ